MKMAFRVPIFSSNSLDTLTGHFSMHTRHPVHFSSSTYRGLRLILTLNALPSSIGWMLLTSE